MSIETDLPDCLKQIFLDKNTAYYFNHETDLDNNEAMAEFINQVGIREENIPLNDGTLIYLYHPDFNFIMTVSCSGNGDCFSHVFETTQDSLETFKKEYPDFFKTITAA